MENIINKINIKKILIFYLILQPIIDIITSLCVRYISESLTLGVFVRTFFMIFIALYALIIINNKDRIKSLIYYILLGIYIIVYLVVCYNQNGMTMILTQIKGVIKNLYLPVVLVALFYIRKEKDIKIENKYFVWTLLGYTASMFITRILGIAYPAYEVGYKEGTEGLFFAANEVGAILGILAPLLFIEFFKERKLINIISIFLLVFSALEIGTKVPFLSMVGLIIVFIIICIIKLFEKKNMKKLINKIGITIVCSLIVILFMGYMPIGKNLGVNFVKVISDKLSSENVENNIIKDDTNKNTNSEINVDITLSGRDAYLANNIERFKNSSLIKKIFGNGYLINAEGEVQVNKLVEMDVFDIIFSHGIIGTILIFLPVIYMFIMIIINIFKNLKKVIFNEYVILICYSIVIAYGISLLAGHVLVAPAVAIFIVFNLIEVDDKLKRINKGEN